MMEHQDGPACPRPSRRTRPLASGTIFGRRAQRWWHGGYALGAKVGPPAGGSGVIGPMFPLYDGNGNVLRVYDSHVASTGVPDQIRADYRYGPFGEERGRQGTQSNRMPFRWSTKYADNETGLTYYGFRYYSPLLGRWTTRDPIEEHDHLNLACFVSNSPTYHVDADGRFKPHVHEELLRKSLRDIYGIHPSYIDRISSKCWDSVVDSLVHWDLDQDNSHLPENVRHYNRDVGYNKAGADAQYSGYIAEETWKFNRALTTKNCRQARNSMGYLAHSWQDFFGHAIRRDGLGGRETGNAPGFTAFSVGVAGTPESRSLFWPSSFDFTAGGEHPTLSEPIDVANAEGMARSGRAVGYVYGKLWPMLDRYFAVCPCDCDGAVDDGLHLPFPLILTGGH